MAKQTKTLRNEILKLIAHNRAMMDRKEGHPVMNPRSLDDWATIIKESSKDLELAAMAGQELQSLVIALSLATMSTACLEEHLGKKIDELMPEVNMKVVEALDLAIGEILQTQKNTGDAATSPA